MNPNATTKTGHLTLTSHSTRSALKNGRVALLKLSELVEAAMVEPKVREERGDVISDVGKGRRRREKEGRKERKGGRGKVKDMF